MLLSSNQKQSKYPINVIISFCVFQWVSTQVNWDTYIAESCIFCLLHGHHTTQSIIGDMHDHIGIIGLLQHDVLSLELFNAALFFFQDSAHIMNIISFQNNQWKGENDTFFPSFHITDPNVVITLPLIW